MNPSIGILGIGSFLPSEVRTNDWWPRHHVDAWREKRINRMTRGALPNDIPHTDGVRIVAEEMARNAHDPFDGGVERRVMSAGTTSGDMEVLASQRALAAAGIDPKDIDVLLTQSMCPDYMTTNNAAATHERLGLRQETLSLETQGVCNAFLLQLQIAEQMIASGRTRYALLVQASPLSRLVDSADPISVWFGDGATAVVVGAVSEGKGLLAMTSRADGTCQRSLVSTVEGKHWWEEGRVRADPLDTAAGRRMLLQSADLGKQVVDSVLAKANLSVRDVDFFACHQASSWFRNAAQKVIGLEHARTVDTYSWAGNITSANLPLVLEVGLKEKLINDGDLVAMYAGGGGMTWSAGLMRWGR